MSISKGIALITGSAQGIGRGIALRLARDGFDIALNDLPSKRDELQSVASDIKNIGRKAHLVPADVTIEDEVKNMVGSTTEKLGGLDVMVANAGIGPLSNFLSTELDEWERVMAVNARGIFLCYKHAAIQMVAQGRGGRIVGASSVVGKHAFPAASAYAASKFAVRGLTQAVALELGRYKITVNAYAPGVIETPLLAAAVAPGGLFEKLDKESVNWAMNHMSRRPIKDNGKPEDIANLVSYLASKEAGFITGQCIAVDGGITVS